MGLPSAELAPDNVPQPRGLTPPSSGLFPVGRGEDDSALWRGGRPGLPKAPREGQAARQEVRQNRLEYLFCVPCPSQWGEVVTQGPHRKGLNCQEGAGSGSQAQQG